MPSKSKIFSDSWEMFSVGCPNNGWGFNVLKNTSFGYASLLLATQFYNKKCVEKLNFINSMRIYHAYTKPFFGCFSHNGFWMTK